MEEVAYRKRCQNMTFTDDDLKRLKDWLELELMPGNIAKQLQALVARLEAAEARIERLLWSAEHKDNCQFWNKNNDLGEFKRCDCGIRETEEAWRKAAGK